MNSDFSRSMSRRGFLVAAAGVTSAGLFKTRSLLASEIDERELRATHGRANLAGPEWPWTSIWGYDGTIPGPTLRLQQGRPARITVANGLDDDTTVHWHGIRLPNRMDGVPGLTQPVIKPGESFVYEFTPPDAGTFWYHPHADSLVQMGRGLAGALIVEEAEPLAADRDVLWMLQDWRLSGDKQIAAGFGSAMDAAMSGRVGNAVTINGTAPTNQPVRAGERVRLRLANASLARIMRLRFEGHRPVIIAIDGQPCDPHEPEDGRLVLAPAMRVDVAVDMQGDPGSRHDVIDDFYDGLAYPLTTLAYDEAPPLRMDPLDAPLALPRNPLPKPDLTRTNRQEIVLQGGMMGGGRLAGVGGMMGIGMPGMNGGAAWAINGKPMTGDGQAGMAPQFTLKRGDTCHLIIRNQTAWWHPMHVHGFSLSLLSRNGSPVPHRQWQDTVLLAPMDTVECAFVADNPGDWMLHCHVADHQMAGLMTVFRVT